MKFGKIELEDWVENDRTIYYRHIVSLRGLDPGLKYVIKLQKSPPTFIVDEGKSSRAETSNLTTVLRHSENIWYVHFYGKLRFLRELFPFPHIEGSCMQAKTQVDDFLIKINNLRAFL